MVKTPSLTSMTSMTPMEKRHLRNQSEVYEYDFFKVQIILNMARKKKTLSEEKKFILRKIIT